MPRGRLGSRVYIQTYNPLGNALLSTIVAALPVLVLFLLLVVVRARVPIAAAGGALAAFVGATLIYHMPAHQAGLAFLSGGLFGLMPICWTIIWAMFLYNTTVVVGTFTDIRNSVAGLSADHRIQGVLIAFCFGAFLEGAAGGGTPVAICAAMLVGLGFDPFLAAGLCLIANTTPVTYGGFGTPLLTLGRVTDIEPAVLNKMAANQLPLLSCIVPLWLVRSMCSWRDTKAVLPAIAVAGGSFALAQFLFARSPSWQLVDIAGGLISLVVTALFLNFWKPKHIWRFETHGKEAAPDAPEHVPVAKMALGPVLKAWLPYLLLCALMIYIGTTNAAPAKTIDKTWSVGSLRMSYDIPIAGLDGLVQRMPPVVAEGTKPEASVFTFNWLSSPGTSVMITALMVLSILRVNRRQLAEITRMTLRQMSVPVPTIVCMLGMAYTTRLSGMDATLGLAFANTGFAYPFFAGILGWLGVFLTGTNAGSNALFGSLQQITANQLSLSPVLITVANSAGGNFGKMISAQSICVASAATNQVGKEADVFKFVFWHSVALASIVGVIVLLQAYVPVFQAMVPSP